MANLQETSTWEAGIYQLETSDPVMGGENGIDNRAPRQLANRTLWLKNELARQIGGVNQSIANANNAKADKAVQFTAGNGLTGGGDLSTSRTLSLGTPSKITANSTNVAVSNTHSHEIDKASTTVQGIVKLNNTLTSTSQTEALTANMGKVLKDEIHSKISLNGLLGTINLNTLTAEHAGAWQQNSNANITDEHNYPTRAAGVLLVLPSVWQGQQIYIPYNSSVIYSRYVKGDASWSDWLTIGETINNLTTVSATASLSALQGKILNEAKLGKTDNAVSASKLQTARNIAMTGDGAWNVNFDGSGNATGALTLANSGVTAGSYNSVTVDAKGRVTAGLTQTHGLVTATTATGTANVATNNNNTFLNIVASGVGQTASVGSSTQITGTNGITVSSDIAGKVILGQTLANSLTDTSTAKALTALQGKVLDEKIAAINNTLTSHRHNWNEIDGKPSTFTPSSHTHTIANITDYDVRQISTEDLDSITKWGIYGQMANNQSLTERNYPVPNEAGTLEVMPGTYGLRQRFTTFATHRQFERSRNNAMTGWNAWIELSNTWEALRGKPNNLAYTSSNVATATKLQTARNIALTGAVTGNANFDGSGNVNISTTLTKAVIRDYNRTINAPRIGYTTNTIDITGQTVISLDGKITQYFHFKHFRDFWFDLEDASVGTGGDRGYTIPLALWTAMPNKVLSVIATPMRSANATLSTTYFNEASELIAAWAYRKQGSDKSNVWVDLARHSGSNSELIDLLVIVEGY